MSTDQLFESTKQDTKGENTQPYGITNDTSNQNQMKNSSVIGNLEQTNPDLTTTSNVNENYTETLFLQNDNSENKLINHEEIDVSFKDGEYQNISDKNKNNQTFQQDDNQKDIDIYNDQICEEGGDNNKHQMFKTNDGEQMDIESISSHESQLNISKFGSNENQNEENNLNENNLMDTIPNIDYFQSDDFESGHGQNENPMPIDSLTNHHTINETNLNGIIPETESDTKPPAPIPYNTTENNDSISRHPKCQFHSGKPWIDLQYHNENNQLIKKPDEIGNEMDEPNDSIDEIILNRIQGSIIGMALGDALGAHVEFRPYHYLKENPVKDLGSGGTWGLEKGQFTDDTSMALCLANSLVSRRDFIPYDQLVRYKWWYNSGYMSSTGQCFDIGAATRQSIVEFQRRQEEFATNSKIEVKDLDYLSDFEALKLFNVYCSENGVAGNGALMRLAPVPLFFYRFPEAAVEFSGYSGQITHGDQKAYDACRYYGALIVAALKGLKKDEILDKEFYLNHKSWFGDKELHPDIKLIAEGSYRKENGYEDGIRGKGYIVDALEAALWAFWSDNDSFEKGALAAVNLGDDTDTTAAIYGQLAGAYYGYKNLPKHWLEHVYAKTFMEKLSKWIVYEGECWQRRYTSSISQ